MPDTTEYLDNIETIHSQYEKEEKSGVFFKIEKEKNPFDILGVLDFLKFKIKKWGNDNIFSYSGNFFKEDTALVIGATNVSEATTIIKYVYLTLVIKNEEDIENLVGHVESIENLDAFLNSEISRNLKNGFPANPEFEVQLKNHLKNLMDS